MCTSPLTGYYGRERTVNGKRPIVFKVDLAFSPVPLRLPCGQCMECRLAHSRQWAMRCMHEKQLHSESCFITLTYDDECLPEGASLRYRDFQLFMKRLRKARGSGVRFYACGEYGETTSRPHYHAIMFNLKFDDLKFYKKNKRGDALYTSKELEGYWPLGLCTVGEVTFDSCAYVARYIVKKVKGDAAADHYIRVDPDGVIYDLVPEFTQMSRRPGIGKEWFAKYGLQSYKWDSVVFKGMECPPPRYYDGLYEGVDPARLEVLKKRRRRKAAKRLKDNTPERRKVREAVSRARLALKGSSL